MSGKQMLIIIIIAVLVGGGGFWLLSRNSSRLKQSAVSKNTVQNPEVTPTLSDAKLLTWNDEAGFTFQYPEGLKIDNHPDDNVDYANLTFTGDDGPGSINILMKDNTYQSLDEWIKSDSNLTTGNIIDTNLGDKNGKKVITSTGQMIIGVIDNGVLVTIKKETGLSPLLETAWGKITDTWEFVYPTPTAADKKAVKVTNSQDTGGNVLEEDN